MSRVLGIDPGYDRLGVAVLEKKEKEILLYSECFETPKEAPFKERLGLVSRRVEEVINEFKPEALAIENLFFNKNQKTAMKVSEVRGALIDLSSRMGLKVYEFTPLQIKIAVTGYGRSDKNQVRKMAEKLVDIKKEIKIDDEFDAIAVGITMLASEKSLSV